NDRVYLLYPLRIQKFSLSKESVLIGDVAVEGTDESESSNPFEWGRVVGRMTRIFPKENATLAFPIGTMESARFCVVKSERAGAFVALDYAEAGCSIDVLHNGVHYSRPALPGSLRISTDGQCEITAFLPSTSPETSALIECENKRVGDAGKRHAGGLSVFTLAGLTGVKTVGLFEGQIPMGCDIVSFSAQTVESGVVQVEWTAKREKNLAVYILERADASDRFVEIARVSPANEFDNETRYTHKDSAPFPGTIRYRIKTVDYNGKTSYSPIVETFIVEAKAWSCVYPNPTVGGSFTLRAVVEVPGWVDVRYLSPTGEIAAQTRHFIREPGIWLHGENTQSLRLPRGVCLVEISTPTRKYHHRLVVQD
ncbi:MAG: hypothetical protein NZ534_03035, partial [Bacteroidia bacterium]|nr:hypothetical protein [Bacteroidia bacterium]